MRPNLGWLQFRRDTPDCPRCGGQHEGLLYRRVRKSTALGVSVTHVAKCPETGEPVILLSRHHQALTWATYSNTGTTGTTSTSHTIWNFLQ